MSKILENFGIEKQEKKEAEPSIRLEFFRHDDKEKTPRESDNLVRLSDSGRVHASEIGKNKDGHPEMGLVYGTSRERTLETAHRQMLANEEIEPEDSLEDIRKKIDEQIKFGKKEIVDDRLNFDWGGTKKFNEIGYEHFLKLKDALRFLVDESDDLAKECKDETSTSYTRTAANFAEVVEKYMNILPRWKQVVEEDKNKEKDAKEKKDQKKGYEKFGNEMQRFCGSHAGTVENFLMKIIEKIDGKEAVYDFINSREDKNCFNFSEGYSVIIKEKKGQVVGELKYQNKTWPITKELLDDIMKERDELDREIKENNF
ncbi:MAG: hypothetical protein MUF50_01200 [Planctomycetes bacterium]|jgi:hypothetical protein|nr:hypothetical protein [Planctomycetota bacterium]